MHSPALDGIYAALLPAKQKPELCRLIERAINAQDAARTHLAKIDHGNWSDSDDAWQRLLDASFEEARGKLLDHLLEHGVTTALANRLGEIL